MSQCGMQPGFAIYGIHVISEKPPIIIDISKLERGKIMGRVLSRRDLLERERSI